MSVVRYQCPFCGQTYDGESTDAGAVGTCEQCGRDFPLVVIATPVTQKRPSGISWYFGMFQGSCQSARISLGLFLSLDSNVLGWGSFRPL